MVSSEEYRRAMIEASRRAVQDARRAVERARRLVAVVQEQRGLMLELRYAAARHVDPDGCDHQAGTPATRRSNETGAATGNRSPGVVRARSTCRTPPES